MKLTSYADSGAGRIYKLACIILYANEYIWRLAIYKQKESWEAAILRIASNI